MKYLIKNNIVIIEDNGYYTGYHKDFPGLIVQEKSIEKVIENILDNKDDFSKLDINSLKQ